MGLLALLLAGVPGGPFGAALAALGGSGAAAEGGVGSIALEVRDADGNLLSGATASVEGVEGSNARATGKGTLRIDGVPVGAQVVVVDAPGFARARLSYEVGRAPGLLEVALDPEILLAGRVVDESGGELGGARLLVRLDADPVAPPFAAVADEHGNFAVHGLPAERVVLEARRDGYEATTQSFELGRGAIEHAIVVMRRSGTLVGRVVRPDGSGAARAEVVLAGSGVWPPRSIVAGEDGTFRWTGLPGGIYEVRARSGGLVAHPIEGLAVGPEREARVELRLIQGVSLQGIVVDVATDAPIAGAVVTVAEEELSLSVRATETGADGRFTLAGLLPVRHNITVQATGYVRSGPNEVPVGGEPIRVELERAATLEGIVVDQRDRPVAGASIEVLGDSGSFAGVASTGFGRTLLSYQAHGPSLLESGGALGVTLGDVPPIPIDGDFALGATGVGAAATGLTTDAEGRFRIDGVAPGTIQIRVQGPPHAPAISPPMRVGPGEVRSELRIVLPDGGEVSGRVLDSGGYPVGFMVVMLHAEREPVPRTMVTEEDGTFSFGGVLGDAVLTALPTDQPAARERFAVRQGERKVVNLRLSTDLKDVRGRVRDARNFPIAGARVSLVSLRSNTPFERSTFTDEDGTFLFAAVPEPPLQVSVDHPAYAPYQSPVIQNRETELRVVLAMGGAVVGTVIDERSGDPIADARVTIRRGGQVLVERGTAADGTFRAERIEPGRISIEVSTANHLSTTVERTVTPDRHGDGELDVGTIRLATAGRIEGRVLDAYGDPVPGATVVLEGGRGAPLEATTSAGGRFAIERVPVGSYMLSASHAIAGDTRETGVRVDAGSDERGYELRTDRRYQADSDDPGAALATGVAVAVRTDGSAVVVTWVAEGSAAERAGVREGDVILAVDEEEVTTASAARSLMRGPVGVPAILEIDRDGRAQHLRVTRETFRPER